MLRSKARRIEPMVSARLRGEAMASAASRARLRASVAARAVRTPSGKHVDQAADGEGDDPEGDQGDQVDPIGDSQAVQRRGEEVVGQQDGDGGGEQGGGNSAE